jgi:hypothetical protein
MDAKEAKIPAAGTPSEMPQEPPNQHLSGIKLYSIMSAIMLAVFLISLDVSIISTVSYRQF